MNRELFARLGNPQVGQNFIHVAGTNGKGSTCAMLDSVLRCAGYRVGLFTSPHLDHYEERIKINGVEISHEEWQRLKKLVDEKAEGLNTVEFDRITAMAFIAFKEAKCDYVVLEVGLGGRLDATNVIERPLVSVIASIGLEHTEILGDTYEKIAFEKAGIIKHSRPVVVMNQRPEVLDVFRNKALEEGCKLTITDHSQQLIHSISLDGQVLSYKNHKGIRLSLLGSFQIKNVCLVLDCIDVLSGQGILIPEDAIKEGLANTTWPGRFEVLRKSPFVVLDGAHNPNCAEELAECIRAYLPSKKITFVMGVLSDKDYISMLDNIAPFAKEFILITPPSHRALNADSLKELIQSKYKIKAVAADTVEEGVKLATANQSFKDYVVIFGSLYQVSEIRKLFIS